MSSERGEADQVRVDLVGDADVTGLVDLWAAHQDVLRPYLMLPPDAGAWAVVTGDPSQRWFTVRYAGALVGAAVLARISGPPWHGADVGVGVAPTVRGRGIGTAALRAVFGSAYAADLARIEALVAPGNAASIRMVAAAGMELESLSRSVLEVDGVREDLGRWVFLR